MRTWFITGCSTGFGKLLTLDLLAAGERVWATARRAEALAKLAEAAGGHAERLHPHALDVTDPGEIRDAVDAALALGPIDVLVNNAGYGYMGTQEEGSLAEMRAMYDVNVFGLVAMTQALLPSMRLHGSGTIVNLSSVAGRIAAPRGGFYQSSKWAVEALSQSLFLECSRFGIKVRVIEPGAYDTDFGTRSIKVQPSLQDETSAYTGLNAEWQRAAGKLFKYGRQDPMEVVAAIRASVERPEGFLRVPVGRDTLDYLEVRDHSTDEEYFQKLWEMGWGRGPDDPAV